MSPPHQQHTPSNLSQKAIDPVCGMTVDPDHAAATFDHQGATYYFCCTRCRDRFKANPEQFLGPANSAGSLPLLSIGTHSCCHGEAQQGQGTAAVKPATAAKYYCPMCPGVESDMPGDCSHCGMALERNPGWMISAGNTIYTCPMHPEVQQDHPGDCPLCGMPLEPKTVTGGADEDENAELRDMTRRLWIGGALTLPVFVLAMAHLIPALAAQGGPTATPRAGFSSH
jgi:P-type Cu+ transporter